MALALRPFGLSIRSLRQKDLLLTLLLLAATLLAYWPALQGGRILDDDLHITPPQLQSVSGLARIWFDIGATQQYYPVVHTAFWVEHHWWGESVAGYHVVNVLLHVGSALLVVALMRRLRLPGAWFAAFIFALHPVAVESVAWIAEQKNTLSTILALGATVLYLRFDEERRPAQFWLALALFGLALLSKTAVVPLPAALLVVAWWRRGRLEWVRDVRPLLPWFALGGAISLVTVIVERQLLVGITADFTLNPFERVLLAGRIFWFYLAKLAWPEGLTFFYPRWQVGAANPWSYGPVLATAALAVLLGRRARHQRGPFAALLAFGLLLAPVLGFFDVEWFVFSFVADHLQYFASLALIVPFAAAAATGALRGPAAARRVLPGLAAAAVLGLGALTWRQCGRYRDAVTFYRTAAELNPDSPVAHNHLGAALGVLPGRMPEAIAQFRIALRLSPHFAEVHENLGTALLPDPAHREEAVAELELARQLRPDRPAAHEKLAAALTGMPGRLPEAIAEFQAALRLDPNNAGAHDGLGLALAEVPSRGAEAEAEFETAIRLQPDFAPAHLHLAKVLAADPARAAAAVGEYETALRLDPNSAQAEYNLANLLLRFPGHTDEALAHYAAALRLQPDFAEAHNNLGQALLNLPGHLNDAMVQFEAALRAQPNFAEAENNLGVALANLPGRLPDAAAHFAAAVRLKPDFAQARTNLQRAQEYLQQTAPAAPP